MAYVGYAGQGYGGTPAGPMAPSGQLQQAGSTMFPGSSPAQAGQATDQMQQLGGLYGAWNQGYFAPTQMLGQAQLNQLQNQMGLTGLQSDLASQLAQQNAGWQQQGLGLSQEQLNVQQGALARQMAILPQTYGLQQQGFDIQQSRLGLQGQGLDINQQQLGLQAAQIGTSADQQRRQLEHQLVASGTAGTPEANAQRADILQNRAFGLFGNQLQKNQLGLQRWGLGLSEADLGLQRQGAAINYYQQTAQNQDAQKMLDIQGKQLGLSGDEIRGRLQNALNQIGISNQVSVDQVLSEMYKTQQGELSPLAGLFGDLYQAGGITVPSTGG